MSQVFQQSSSLISLRGIHFRYPPHSPDTEPGPVLEDFDLEVRPGETVAFMGPNGCGKSSLLKLLCGIHHAAKGSYRYRGREISRQSLKDQVLAKSFRQDLGLVFQNPEVQLFCSRVDEEIAFGPRAMGLGEADISARVRDCMDLLDIANLADKPPFMLSGGEKRKVALASVLALDPGCLVLDEPMNGLDPASKRELAALLVRLRDAGKTILCSTHDFAWMDGIFDRAVVIGRNHRKVRDAGYHEVLADREFLAAHNIE